MNNTANITCPKCGAEIPLTEAVSHRLRAELQAEFDKQRKEQNVAMEARELNLKKEREQIELQAKSIETTVEKRLQAERASLLDAAAAEAQSKLGVQITALQSLLTDKNKKLKESHEAQLELLKEKAKIEEAGETLKLELAKQLEAERSDIARHAREQAIESERLKLAEKEDAIKGLQKKIDDLQQRANQGSMQLQGETLELALETDLRQAFPLDEISEVKKGQLGADIEQRVRTNIGAECGVILWEAKRAKNWSGNWIAKLKEDQRGAKAELAVLVATCPPEKVRGIGQIEGVWVCEPPFACALAAALRHGLIATAVQRSQESGRADKMAQLYDYLCGTEFRQHIEAIVESFKGLQEQLNSERNAFARQWKEREKQINRAIQHTAMLYGGIQGIAGRAALPEIVTLSLPGAGIDSPAPVEADA